MKKTFSLLWLCLLSIPALADRPLQEFEGVRVVEACESQNPDVCKGLLTIEIVYDTDDNTYHILTTTPTSLGVDTLEEVNEINGLYDYEVSGYTPYYFPGGSGIQYQHIQGSEYQGSRSIFRDVYRFVWWKENLIIHRLYQVDYMSSPEDAFSEDTLFTLKK